MDEASAFLQEFVKREYEAAIARAGDPYPAFNKKLAAAEAMLAGPNFTLDMERDEDIAPDELARMAKEDRPDIIERPIFVVQRYRHARMGEIYRAIMSNNLEYSRHDFRDLFVVQRQKEGLKIISHSRVCTECNGAGEIKGTRCIKCYGARWIAASGMKIADDYGTLVETHKLQPPRDPVQRADYDAL